MLERSNTGTIFFMVAALVEAVSIIPPTIMLIGGNSKRQQPPRGARRIPVNGSASRSSLRSSPFEQRVGLMTILLTWCAPIFGILACVDSAVVTMYRNMAYFLLLIVASNLLIFTFLPKHMKRWQWIFIGFILSLILLQAHLFLVGPSGPLAHLLLPFHS